MSESKRGFHFLAGLAVIWLAYRLYSIGWLHDVGFLMAGEPVTQGPGAILVAFVIEGIIAIGWVATLTVSGLWDAAMVVGRLIGDTLKAAHAYLFTAAKARQIELKAAKPSTEPAKPADASIPDPITPEQALLATIADTRKQNDEQQTAIVALMSAVEKLTKQLEEKSKPTTRKRTEAK